MTYERLTIKRNGKNYIKTPVDGVHDFLVITNRVGKYEYTTGEAIDRLAELEDKIENGTLVELPCKVGDKVFTNIYGYGNLQNVFTVVSVDLLGFSSELYSWTWHQLGKSVFLTKAEAEAKLKKLQEEQK